MSRTLSIALLLLSTALAQGQAAAPGPAPLSHEDEEFLTYAAQDNQAEIALCLLAEKKAASPAVKAFARLMVDDHAEIESRLAAVAEVQKAALPEGVGKDGQETHDRLDPLSGAGFDRAFISAQIKDHENDLKRFAHQASTTSNASLRQFAGETGPLLDQHLALARAVEETLKSEK